MRYRLRVPMSVLVVIALFVGGISSAQTPGGEASVSIVSPPESYATNAQTLQVVVAFQAHGNMQDIDLLINGQRIETETNPANIKSGQMTFDVDLSGYQDQTLEIVAVGYQGNRTAGLATSSEVRHVLLSRVSPVDVLYLTAQELKRMNVESGQELASFEVGPNVGDYSVSDDRQKILLVGGTDPWNLHIDVLDVSTGVIAPVLTAAWTQTLSFLPGSHSQFVYNDDSGNLWLHDIDAGTTALWQKTDTASQDFGKNVYRGGIVWTGDGSEVVARIGVGGDGGDGVFIGDACDDGEGHHICDLSAVWNPAGWSSDWATIAGGPSVSTDGHYAFYYERVNFNIHSIWRQNLATGELTLIHQETRSIDDAFSGTSLVDDRYLVFTSLPVAGVRPVYLCDVQDLTPCSTVQMPTSSYWTVKGIHW